MSNVEPIILKLLIENEQYMRTVIPFLKAEYFQDMTERLLFSHINDFIGKYNACPTKEAILIAVNSSAELSDDELKSANEYVDFIAKMDMNQNMDWAVENTETFCRDKALYNAIMKSIRIYEGKNTKEPRTAIPSMLTDALAVSFDTRIGHDYLEDLDDRFAFYHENLDRIPFDLEMLNLITKGGTPDGTLNVILAGTNVGKTLIMCHMASANLLDGKNVLYVTMEDSEARIAERIDVNLLDVDSDNIRKYGKDEFTKRVTNRVLSKTNGKLIIKEYPSGSFHSGHLRYLLNDLKLKKKFVPDIIYLDYLNECASSRIKLSEGSYTFIKAIAQEMRGIAKEFDIPLWTATQTNRGAQSSSDVDLDDTSESFGLPQVADLMLAVMQPEELEALKQYLIKQVKNRYRDKAKNKRFVVGVDKDKQRLYDVSNPTEGISPPSGGNDDDDKPLFDKGNIGSRMCGGGKEREFGFNFDVS